MKLSHLSIVLTAILLSACATTPEQQAAMKLAQQRSEQNLQVALAAQCDTETANLLRQQFEQNIPTGEQERQAFRQRYVDKISEPMFQACYKMAWQNYISQQKLQRVYDYYDLRENFYPWGRPFWW